MVSKSMMRVVHLMLLLTAVAAPAAAVPIARFEYVETDLGGGRFQYDYTLFNDSDPMVDLGFDIFDVTVESATNTFSNLVAPTGWDGFGGFDFAIFFAPVGLEVAPGASLAGFRFEVDAQIGAIPFLVSFTNPGDPASPVAYRAVSAAAPSSVPEPTTLLLLGVAGPLYGLTLIRNRRRLRRGGSLVA
jgi:hypothetical protein